jgi:hypothetical protein
MAGVLGYQVMRLLQLSRHRKARVWFNEAPNAGYSPSSFVRRVVSVGPASPPATRIAAIELMVPRGPRASYGLLGAKWIDSRSRDGEVSVAVNNKGFLMQESLAVMPDDVRLGLLDEYAAAVVSGVESVVSEGWRFGGELNFRWAAHAAAGSSSAFFTELGALVAGLLAMTTVPSDNDLVRLFS